MGQGAACTSPASIHSVSGSKQPFPWAASKIIFLIILLTLPNSSGLLNLLSAARKNIQVPFQSVCLCSGRNQQTPACQGTWQLIH